jgi:hypothetical protein
MYAAEALTEPETLVKLSSNIDRLGVLSGIDQNLKGPITSIERLKESDHRLYIFVYTNTTSASSGSGGDENVAGFLKVGVKNLFFYVSQVKPCHDVSQHYLCICPRKQV